jgi:primosomal protein N' (replication factor Y)
MLPARVGLAVLPTVKAVDMRLEDVARGNWVSPTLANAVADGSSGRSSRSCS